MRDLTIALQNRPGALAEMGEALGLAGVSIEGGGVFVFEGVGIGHFLFHDAAAARAALERAEIPVIGENEVVMLKLRQGEPGQLGKLARLMAKAGVNIKVQYSDHDHNLVLVASDVERARIVSRQWMNDGRSD